MDKKNTFNRNTKIKKHKVSRKDQNYYIVNELDHNFNTKTFVLFNDWSFTFSQLLQQINLLV